MMSETTPEILTGTIARETQPASIPEQLDRVYRVITRGLRDAAASSFSEEQMPATTRVEPCIALEHLETVFQLTPFERDVLLLCAGASLESRFANVCAAVHGDPHATWPTLGMAIALLEEPHWSAISRARPLRYWRLIEGAANSTLLSAPLRIDERILQYLIGVPAVDERLEPLFHLLPENPGSSHYASASRLAVRHWSEAQSAKLQPLLLMGSHASSRQTIFEEICQEVHLLPYALNAADIPTTPAECEQVARLWTRESILTGAAVYIKTASGENTRSLTAFLDLLKAPVALEVPAASPLEQVEGLRVHVPTIATYERKTLWMETLGPLAARMNGSLDRLAEYFQFDERDIRTSGAIALDAILSDQDSDPSELAWRICREHARRSLDMLALRIEPHAQWPDLILPGPQLETLRQLTTHVRQRAVVNEAWGFANKHARGLGLSVLFAGASGTGKTMAAEILAGELGLDLYQIDLSAVVSKYIGETETNLRKIFASAEESGAVLLFDEADALFGKRSEVRDSHDRYANLEISYLLQRMESYRGVAILTTNMQPALDPAFLRRIRFIVQFPFPDAPARRQIWQRIFPAAAPTSNLNLDQLAQLNISGGVIRNIAVHAAFLAAEDKSPIEMRHALAASRTEYQKMDKPLTATETRGWA
jgi:ATPase family protein associated with various cellular activities (AAA)/winged helix domain-containing protein